MELNEYQNIIDFAMKNEIAAEAFYIEIAEKVSKPRLKEMFTAFSKEEKKHQDILNNLSESKNAGSYFTEDRDYGVSETVEKPEISDNMTLSDAYAIAMKNEENAMKLYQNLAQDCKSPEIRKVLEDLATMERDHKFKMETSYTDVSFPEVW